MIIMILLCKKCLHRAHYLLLLLLLHTAQSYTSPWSPRSIDVCPFIVTEDSIIITTGQFGVHTCLQSAFQRRVHIFLRSSCCLPAAVKTRSVPPPDTGQAWNWLDPLCGPTVGQLLESVCHWTFVWRSSGRTDTGKT